MEKALKTLYLDFAKCQIGEENCIDGLTLIIQQDLNRAVELKAALGNVHNIIFISILDYLVYKKNFKSHHQNHIAKEKKEKEEKEEKEEKRAGTSFTFAEFDGRITSLTCNITATVTDNALFIQTAQCGLP
eukprot:15352742-Ditylum_brightwellii.AAC.1